MRGGASIPVYHGYSSQYGSGLGNVLGGVLRAAVPHIAPLVKAAGHRLLDAGINAIERRVTGREPTPYRQRGRAVKRNIFRGRPPVRGQRKRRNNPHARRKTISTKRRRRAIADALSR